MKDEYKKYCRSCSRKLKQDALECTACGCKEFLDCETNKPINYTPKQSNKAKMKESIKGKWIKSDDQNKYHFVEDFSFYDYPISGCDSICGIEYELNGFKGGKIISEVVDSRPLRACNDCLNRFDDVVKKTYPDDFLV